MSHRIVHARKALTRCTIALVAFVALAGCSDAPPTPATTLPAFAKPETRLPVIAIDVYQMTVPRGVVSRSDEFWKRVDEQRIDPGIYDLLLKNGVRVGIAPTSEWSEYFHDIFERNNARTTKGAIMASGSGSLELTMKKNIKSQDIFYLNDRNELCGQTHDDCDNLLGVSYWADSRTPGALHLTLAPTVRDTVGHLKFNLRNEEQEIREVKREYLYELNLRAVIPPDFFLVVAPSAESRWATSVGNTFLVTDDEVDQKEQVLVFVPKIVRR